MFNRQAREIQAALKFTQRYFSQSLTDSSNRLRRPIVAVGLSGGVDSAVSALLLKEKGFDVRPMYMVNWDPIEEQGICPGEQDRIDALNVAKFLNLELTEVNFVKEYWLNVFEEMLEGYKDGITPNPDLLCNRFVKFAAFRDHAINRMGADYIAFGHYARILYPLDSTNFVPKFNNLGEATNYTFDPLAAIPPGSGAAKLISGVDPVKDQTYFLSHVLGGSFDQLIFPVGQFYKSQVRAIAERSGIPVAKKNDSTGLCFVGPRSFKSLISNYIPDADMLTGPVVALHDLLSMITLLCLTSKPFKSKQKNISGLIKPQSDFLPDRTIKPVPCVSGQTTTQFALFSDQDEIIPWKELFYQAIAYLSYMPYDGKPMSGHSLRPLFQRKYVHFNHSGLTTLTEGQKIKKGGLPNHLYTVRKIVAPSMMSASKNERLNIAGNSNGGHFDMFQTKVGIAVVSEKPEVSLIQYPSVLIRAFNWLSPQPDIFSLDPDVFESTNTQLSLDVSRSSHKLSCDSVVADNIKNILSESPDIGRFVTDQHIEFAMTAVRSMLFPLQRKETTDLFEDIGGIDCFAKSRSTEELFAVKLKPEWIPSTHLTTVPFGAGNKLAKVQEDESIELSYQEFSERNYKAIRQKIINGEQHELCYRIYFADGERSFMAAGQSITLYRKLPSTEYVEGIPYPHTVVETSKMVPSENAMASFNSTSKWECLGAGIIVL